MHVYRYMNIYPCFGLGTAAWVAGWGLGDGQIPANCLAFYQNP